MSQNQQITIKFIGETLQILITRVKLVMGNFKISMFLLKRILKTQPMFAAWPLEIS